MRSLINRICDRLEEVQTIQVTPDTASTFAATRKNFLATVIEMLDDGLCMVQKTPDGVSLVEDECLTCYFVDNEHALPVLRQALGLRGAM